MFASPEKVIAMREGRKPDDEDEDEQDEDEENANPRDSKV